MELWQKAFITALLGFKNKKGLRRFTEAVLIIPRKQGKTTLASGIMESLSFLDNEFGAEFYCIAPKLDQADIVYTSFYQMCLKSPAIAKRIKKRKSDIYIESSNTLIKKIAFNEKTADGLNPSFVVCDEIHAWRGMKGLKQYEVMKSGMGSRVQPLILSLSTAGYEDDGIFDKMYLRATKFLNGDSEEESLLPFIYELDNIEKWDDLEEIKKCTPNYGISINEEYLKNQLLIAKQDLSSKAEFLTKHCNIKQNSACAWLNRSDIVKHFKDLKLEDFERYRAVAGIDLSQRIDLTACSVVIKKDGVFNVFVQFFMPRNRLIPATEQDHIPYEIFRQQGYLILSGEDRVDYRDCFKWYTDLVKKYKIYPLKVGYDRYMARDLVEDMAKAGFHMDDVHQGENLSPILTNFEGLFREGKIKFHNNNLLKAHLLNVAVKINTETRKRKPIKTHPNSRIDGFVSVIDAFTVLDKYHKEIGLEIENKGR